MQTMNEQAPWGSMRFAGSVSMEADATVDASKLPAEKPIRIIARTGGEAYQDYWGRCVHDMAGFIPARGPVNLDYAHKPDVSIGVATVKVVDGSLVAQGTLIPFSPQDDASQVIFKGSKGIPFQASIVMDPKTAVVKRVADGDRIKVNGTDFTGPLTVFTKWGIDGIAILPYGSDSDTSVEFARGKPDVSVSIETPIKEAILTDPVITAPVASVVAPVVAPVANPDNFSRTECLKFKTDFGPAGQDWYLEGKSYSEAAKLFGASIQAKLDAAEAALTAKNAELAAVIVERDEFKNKSEFKRGQLKPVAGKPGEAEPEKPAVEPLKNFGRSKSQLALAAQIEASMKKSNLI